MITILNNGDVVYKATPDHVILFYETLKPVFDLCSKDKSLEVQRVQLLLDDKPSIQITSLKDIYAPKKPIKKPATQSFSVYKTLNYPLSNFDNSDKNSLTKNFTISWVSKKAKRIYQFKNLEELNHLLFQIVKKITFLRLS